MAKVVIHSEGSTRDQIARVLQQAGLDVAHAPPEGGLVHVLDLRLADALKIASHPTGTMIAVVEPADRSAALAELGSRFEDVVIKPIDDEVLAARVQTAVRRGQAVRQRSRALRMVAHDVNNPLTAIRLLAEMLAAEVQSAEAQQDMNDILEASDLAAAYIESLSALAKLEGRTGHAPGSSSVDAAPILAGVLRRPCMRTHVSADPPREPLVVRADRPSLQQSILDLLLTARRLTNGQGGCRISARKSPAGVTISVEAAGAAIPEHLVHHLYEPYGAAVLQDAKVTVAPAGLAHASRFASRVGGELRLTQRPSGVRFDLSLPAAATA